jgi:hypothetical protein
VPAAAVKNALYQNPQATAARVLESAQNVTLSCGRQGNPGARTSSDPEAVSGLRQADEVRASRGRGGAGSLRLHRLRRRPAAGSRRPQVGRKSAEASGEVTNTRVPVGNDRSVRSLTYRPLCSRRREIMMQLDREQTGPGPENVMGDVYPAIAI